MDQTLQKSIEQLLQKETDTVIKLVDLLQQEGKLLRENNAEDLPNILKFKSRALDTLAQTQQIREQILNTESLSANLDWKNLLITLDTLPENADQEKSLQQHQHELEQHLKACQYHNHINSQLINRGLYSVHNLLNILRGNSGFSKTYNQLGETETRLGTKALTQV